MANSIFKPRVWQPRQNLSAGSGSWKHTTYKSTLRRYSGGPRIISAKFTRRVYLEIRRLRLGNVINNQYTADSNNPALSQIVDLVAYAEITVPDKPRISGRTTTFGGQTQVIVSTSKHVTVLIQTTLLGSGEGGISAIKGQNTVTSVALGSSAGNLHLTELGTLAAFGVILYCLLG